MIFARDFLTDQSILRSAGAPNNPLVSIVLPTYCRGQNGMLERSITSVLSQTFGDFELIVMDDGSTDGSNGLIEHLRNQDPRLIHVRHERNSGIHSVRLNEGMELARGQYIAFQFDDDVWMSNALQSLVSEAGKRSSDAVIVGHCRRSGADETGLPYVAINQVTLSQENRLGNNAVLFPRRLMEHYGMYDCHLGMRRLCDWDLWLRYVKHVPFIVIDAVVSHVFQDNLASIGKTVPWDPTLFRYLNAIPRDHLLTPACWHGYEIDSLQIGDVEIAKDIRQRLYELHIAPYYQKFRHHFPIVEGFPATLPYERHTALYISSGYEPTQDIAFEQYDSLSNRRGAYKTYYQQIDQVSPDWVREADAALLAKPVQQQAKAVVHQALANNVPIGVYLDDDILTFHEFGPEFAYLAPGSTAYSNLTEMIQQADVVWVTNSFIAQSVQPYNPRIIYHNGCVPEEALPAQIRPRASGRPIKIGYVGNAYRLEEFQAIWDAIMRLSREYQDQISFEFWGMDVSSLPRLDSPVVQRPFVSSYAAYLADLRAAAFDVLLTPLLDHPRPRLGKSPSKYYQTAVAGALGIFSDVPQYASLPAGLTCLKAENTVEAWYQALREAVSMPVERFDLMRQRMLAHVRDEYTEVAQINLHEAAWRATELHAKTRAVRYGDGRPRVMYFLHSAIFGGGELQLWRRLRLARRYGIEPIVVIMKVYRETADAQAIRASLEREQIQLEFADYTCYAEPHSPAEYWRPAERESIRELIIRCKPALVHSVIFIPTVGQICTELNMPHVTSQYAVDDQFAWTNGRPGFRHNDLVQSDTMHYARRWGLLLDAPKFCAREVVPEEVFHLGQTRYLEALGQPAPALPALPQLVLAGTFQKRKQQLETIEAVGRLAQEGLACRLDLYGYTHFFPRYLAQCQECIHKYGLEERVRLPGFSANVDDILQSADIVLSLSTFESFPSAIKEAMAAGVLVVATPVGGVQELLIDGITGILCADTTVEALTAGIRRALNLSPIDRQRIISQARRVAHSEFHPQRAANDLLIMYNRVLELASARTSVVSPPSEEPPAESKQGPAGRLVAPALAPKGYVRLVRGINYRVVPEHCHWMGIDVQVITQGHSPEGTLSLQVKSPTGQLIRRTAIDLSGVRDHDWLKLAFDPIANSNGVTFSLVFALTGATPETVVAFYETEPLESTLLRAVRRTGVQLPGHTLYCRMWYSGSEAT